MAPMSSEERAARLKNGRFKCSNNTGEVGRRSFYFGGLDLPKSKLAQVPELDGSISSAAAGGEEVAFGGEGEGFDAAGVALERGDELAGGGIPESNDFVFAAGG